MDPVLSRPIPEPERSAEEMLDELFALDDALERQLLGADDAVRARYERELLPKLEEAERLVDQKNGLAKNFIEDAIVLFREALTHPAR